MAEISSRSEAAALAHLLVGAGMGLAALIVMARALDLLRKHGARSRVIVFARAVTTPDEDLRVVTLAEARPEMADMRTMVLIGSSATRLIERDGTPFVYTPRSVPE